MAARMFLFPEGWELIKPEKKTSADIIRCVMQIIPDALYGGQPVLQNVNGFCYAASYDAQISNGFPCGYAPAGAECQWPESQLFTYTQNEQSFPDLRHAVFFGR